MSQAAGSLPKLSLVLIELTGNNSATCNGDVIELQVSTLIIIHTAVITSRTGFGYVC